MSAAQERRAQKHLETLSSQRQLNIDDATKALLNAANGRDFLWWLLEIAKVSHQPFTTNALTTAFQCGELNVGQQVLALITKVDPAGYVRMQLEKAEQFDGRTNPRTESESESGAGGTSPGGFDYDAPEREARELDNGSGSDS